MHEHTWLPAGECPLGSLLFSSFFHQSQSFHILACLFCLPGYGDDFSKDNDNDNDDNNNDNNNNDNNNDNDNDDNDTR